MKSVYKCAILSLTLLLSFTGESFAQFQTGSGYGMGSSSGRTVNNQKARTDTTTEQVFSFKRLFRGLAHKDTMAIGYAFGASMVVPGLGQVYNRDYWKIPVIYAGLGTTIGLGVHYNNLYKSSVAAAANIEGAVPDKRYKNISTACFVGAGLIYWAQLLDVNISYKIKTDKAAGKATIYSILFPGAGQAYNGEYWKIPIYTGGLTAGIYFWTFYNKQYQRYKRIHNEATNPDIPYDGPIGAETALYYRDSFRRSRDIAVVSTILVYILQIIDANVFSYMADFEVSDDLALRLEPAIISPLNIDFASTGTGIGMDSAVGLKIGVNF